MRRETRRIGGALVAALALSGGLIRGAIAQGPMMFGGAGGPGGPNPLMSNTLGLLQRPEVENELHIDMNQRNAIDDLQNSSRDAMQQRMQQIFQSISIDFQSIGSLSPEERQQKMQGLQAQMEAARTAFQGELNDQVKKILKPAQLKRLHQLDLQRRGPLSMADPKVADELKLSPEHRVAIAKIGNDYQQETGQVMRDAFQQMHEQIQQNGGSQPGEPPPFPDFTSKQSPYRQKLDKIRKGDETKVMALLSDDENAAWKAAIGAPFTFRPDPPMLRPGFGGPGGPGGPGE